MNPLFFCILYFSSLFPIFLFAIPVNLGVDQLFDPSSHYVSLLKGKRIGLITNQTGVNQDLVSTIDLFKMHKSRYGYTLKAFFAPEHGLTGNAYASASIQDSKDREGIPIYSLHGTTRRPTSDMLKEIDLIVFDIQDIGSRSYTFSTTLYYAMEEAAKRSIPVMVLDRPNPINGVTIDGPMMEEKWRSFVGYLNIPYCHGMTIGELASFFNGEYKVGCQLTVVPMKGWNRKMTFEETGLHWIPPSPHVPEAETSYFYPTTGLLGELQMVSTGIGYTLPFKVIGAPWIEARSFAAKLNEQNYPGVRFLPFHYRPFFGRFEGKDCQGVLIMVTDPSVYLPVTTQYLIIGLLKTLYPIPFMKALNESASRQEMFNKINGTAEVYRIIKDEKYVSWKLRDLHLKERQAFGLKRKKYLLADYL